MKRVFESSFKDQFNYKFRRIKSLVEGNCEIFFSALVSL